MKNLHSHIYLLLLGAILLAGISSCNSASSSTGEVSEAAPKAVATNDIAKPAGPNQIAWMSFEEVEKKMKKNPKKIFVDVYTEWCGPCKMMDRNTFSNPDIAKYVNDNFYAVKFDAQHTEEIKFVGKTFANPNYDHSRPKRSRNATHQLSAAMGVRAFPTIVFFNEKMEMMQAVPGYKTPQQLQPLLEAYNKI